MGRPSRFSPEVRERAVRMVEEHREAPPPPMLQGCGPARHTARDDAALGSHPCTRMNRGVGARMRAGLRAKDAHDGGRAQVLPEDPILLAEIRDQIVLVAVHPASERENEEL